jgi:hypothetical protein
MKTIVMFDASGHGVAEEFLGVLTQGSKSEAFKPNDQEHDEEACVPNISSRERLKRLIGGVIPFFGACHCLFSL